MLDIGDLGDLLVFCWVCRYEALSLNQKQKRWRGFGRIFYDAETAEHVAGGETNSNNIEFQQLKGVLMGLRRVYVSKDGIIRIDVQKREEKRGFDVNGCELRAVGHYGKAR